MHAKHLNLPDLAKVIESCYKDNCNSPLERGGITDLSVIPGCGCPLTDRGKKKC